MRKSVEKGDERKKFTDEKKRTAVMEYRMTGNASAVARKYGIARTTFTSWVRLFANVPTDNTIVAEAVVSAIDKASEAVVRSIDLATATRQQFIMEHYNEIGRAPNSISKLSLPALRALRASPTATSPPHSPPLQQW